MTTARTADAAGSTGIVLANGKVLVTGGLGNTGFLASAELYDPTTGTWSTTGSMAYARARHTTTLLPNGKVLVAGGVNGAPSDSAELYDPTTGTWSITGNMTTSRMMHTATLLDNGKVLVTGGYGSSVYHLANAELYDPTTGTWSATGSMTFGRYSPTATLLHDGRVLVAGGAGTGSALEAAELYDPTSGGWTTTGFLAYGRVHHTGTLLPSGQVLVAGGQARFGGQVAGAELYDPATGVWSTAGLMTEPRQHHVAALLRNGLVLVAAGYHDFAYVATAELYNPSTGAWSTTTSLNYARYAPTIALLTGGNVLVAGGNGSVYGTPISAEIYEPASIVPSTPGAPLVTPGNGLVDLSWVPPADGGADITGYTVAYQASGDSAWTETSPTPSTATTMTILGLTNGTTYAFKVLASNVNGPGDYSAETTAVPATVPDAPVAPMTAPGDQQVDLSWTAPANGGAEITGYTVAYRASDDVTWAETTPIPATATSMTITGLENFTLYVFRVRASNVNGPSDYSDVATAVPFTDVPPVAAADAYSGLKNYVLNVTALAGVLANDSDRNGDSLTAVQVSGPSHGMLTIRTDGSFAYTPTRGYAGVDQFTYRAVGNAVQSNLATVTLTVTEKPKKK